MENPIGETTFVNNSQLVCVLLINRRECSQQRNNGCTTICLSSKMETRLLKVQSDVLSSIDEEGSVAVLVLLDLSDAFDTIDHTFILSC